MSKSCVKLILFKKKWLIASKSCVKIILFNKVAYRTQNVAQERLSITCETLMTQIRMPRGWSDSKLFERVISRWQCHVKVERKVKIHQFNFNLSWPLKCQTVWAPIRSGQNVGPDLGQNCLQMLSADDMSDILMQKVKYNGFDPELSEPKELPKEFWREKQFWSLSGHYGCCIHIGIPR